MLKSLRQEIKESADPKRAEVSQRFFKTGKGQYGFGDIFLGLTVSAQRVLAIKYKDLALTDIEKLLTSKIHEERLIALLILVHIFQKRQDRQKEIYDQYIKFTKYINNWDLVDASADKIVGAYLEGKKDRKILIKLAKSKNLWERRIAMVATYKLIKNNSFDETIKIAVILIADKNDLIQKAVGWMLREMGKRDEKLLVGFLKMHYKNMGRTALRYAIEKFPEAKRKSYLIGSV